MVSNPYFMTPDAQLYEVARALSGGVDLKKIIDILGKTDPHLYPQVYRLLEDKVGVDKASVLFSEAEQIMKSV